MAKVILWVHSGGVDPDTGLPSLTSRLRLEELEIQYAMQVAAGVPRENIVVVISGEATRKSGGWQQAQKLAEWLENRNADWMVTRVYNTAMPEAYQRLAFDFALVDSIVFINDDAHMSRYLLEFACANPLYAAKVQAVAIRVVGNRDYVDAYPVDYMVAYNTAAWLRFGVKHIGPWQMALFMLDRAFNKPTDCWLIKLFVAVVGGLLRRDLR